MYKTPNKVCMHVCTSFLVCSVNNGCQTPLLVSKAADNSYEVSRILFRRTWKKRASERHSALFCCQTRVKPFCNKLVIHGCTPLYQAPSSFSQFTAGVIKALLKAGTDIHSRDQKGKAPLHIAFAQGRDDHSEFP